MLGLEWSQENWRAGSARPGVQDQQCSAGPHAGIEDRDHPQVKAVLLLELGTPLPSPHPDRQARSRRQGTAHRQGQHEPEVGQAKPDTSRAGSNFQLLQFPGLSVAELRAKQTQLV